MIKSAQAVTVDFETSDSDGNLQDADSLPTGTLVVDGTDNAAVVTVTNKATGIYKAAVTLPSLTAGQQVSIRIEATVDSITTGATIWRETADTIYPSEIPASIGVPTLYAPSAATRDVGDNDGGDYTNLAAHDESAMVTGELSGASTVEGDRMTVTVTKATSTLTEVPTVARVAGFYYGTSAHEITVYAYNYASSAYERVGTMRTRSTSFSYVFPLDVDNHDSGTGEMKLQFKHSTGISGNASHYLSLDWVSFEKVSSDSQFASDIAFLVSQSIDIDSEVDNIEEIVEGLEEDLATLGASGVTLTNPVAEDGDITIYSGDDYTDAEGRALEFEVSDSSHLLGLDDEAAEVRLVLQEDTWTATTVTSTDDGYDVVFEPTAEETAALTYEKQSYELEATTAADSNVTLQVGTCTLVEDVTEV